MAIILGTFQNLILHGPAVARATRHLAERMTIYGQYSETSGINAASFAGKGICDYAKRRPLQEESNSVHGPAFFDPDVPVGVLCRLWAVPPEYIELTAQFGPRPS